MKSALLECDGNTGKFKCCVTEREVGLERKMGRETSLVDDGKATPAGRAGKRSNGVTAWGQVGDLCFITVGTKPSLSEKHQVDRVVCYKC